MSKNSFYISTPIYYPSDNLHIGHAYTTVAADCIARYKRIRGYDVLFLTGSDEHGQKIERTAKAQGKTPIEYVDKIVAGFKHLWSKLEITNDDFIRTTEDRHKRVVQEIFKLIYDKGDIYKSDYEGLYCTPCETFWTKRQVNEGNCPDCGRPVELVKEESYFFRMSKYADQLLKYIEDNPEFIQPVSRRNEMVSFIKGGLEDLCISRTTFDWGIPVPINEKHVIYVWFDALTNYLSVLDPFGEDKTKLEKYWPCDVHLVGKDIVRFHTVIWPIILMAAGFELPKKVMGHGWLLLDGGKMSKSKGNVVDPLILIDKYGVDSIRYYLLRELPFGSDGYYSEEALVQRINSDLANDLGNLVSRTIAMIEKYFAGKIVKPGAPEGVDNDLREMAINTAREVTNHMDNLELSNALSTIWRFVSRTNKYIDETMPWALAKDESTKERLATVMFNLAEAIRFITVMISPCMPMLPVKIWNQLGITDFEGIQTWDSLLTWGNMPIDVQVQRGEVLFPRIDWSKEVEEEGKNVKGEKKVNTKAEVKVETKVVANEITKETEENKVEYITIDEFAKVDLRIAEVIECEKVEKADKLLKLTVKVGEETRTVVSGIAKHYSPEEMVGKKVVLVANLKPTKLRGILSEGMILAASDADKLEVLTIDKDIDSGNPVK